MVIRTVGGLLGFVILLFGALMVRGLSEFVGINELLLAIGFGVLVVNTVGIPEGIRPGIATHEIWLATGIVLLGSSLTIESIVETGASVLLLVAGTVTFTILTVEVISRYFAGLTERLGSLLAAGTGVCGVSAVVAVGGAVRAREVQMAYAAGVVLLIDAVSIVVYPTVGSLFAIPDIVFGVWAGVSMLSTGPVVAVGFAHSEVAGEWATMTKLARNALIGVIALVYASYYAHHDAEGSPSLRVLWATFPKFIIGFLALVVLASAGVFSPEQQASISNAVDWLFLLAFVGLGTEIHTADLRQTGVVPALVVTISVLIVSILSLWVAFTLL